MLDYLLDALLDTLKIIPFLYLSFLFMEYIEHKAKNKIVDKIKNGPLYASLLGSFPQCGFSVMGANLFSNKMISIGTLIAIFISTSDEAFLVLLSNGITKENVINILMLLLCKVILAIIVGYIIDFFIKSKIECDNLCCNHCGCEKGIFLGALNHTIKISFYILIITCLLNLGIYFIGEDNLSNFLLKGKLFQPFLISLVGLIPNCVSSIIITELFLNGSISFFGCLGGLVAAGGAGYLVLFKENKNLKENLKIVFIIYLVSVLVGFLGLL